MSETSDGRGSNTDSERQRLRLLLRGAVQGVGFRPFVYRLATELDLNGWTANSAQGLIIEVEGAVAQLQRFRIRLEAEKPVRAVVQSLESSYLPAAGLTAFEIRESDAAGNKSALILPDIATCEDCLRELFSPNDRRYRYPFTNCTNCGPRFSIITALPYDRGHTSMRRFAMCDACAREYGDPCDRRFHAEPIACPDCGPQLQLSDSLGETRASREEALLLAVADLRAGKIVALKGLGGFQLLVAAEQPAAVARLRLRKERVEKPFAVMFPSLASARACCAISPLEERLLLSPESPIVLLRKLPEAERQIAAQVAPRNPNLGVMLPYTPLHHLLLRELNLPVVATSGNLSDEPICIDESEARERLAGIADSFLVHDRPIVRHVDDSIVRVMNGRELVLRRARGFAPLPVCLRESVPTILAVGAHLKNTVALSVGRDLFVSQHLGDLATVPAHSAFRRSLADLPRLYEAQPELIAHDLHPDYLSTRAALALPARHFAVQHHWAHIAGCMAENDLVPPALGVSWDGTGYGPDGSIWGGEFLLALPDGRFTRAAHLRTFPLPGGDQAIREPRRSALGLLSEIFGEQLWQRPELLRAFQPSELPILRQMLEKKINAPHSSSAGRLFDAVTALIGLRQRASFEGQAAMELEFAAETAHEEKAYPFTISSATPAVVDWEPAIRALLEDFSGAIPPATIAAKFQRTLTSVIVAVARLVRQPHVVLSGGCFQNRLLTETTIAELRVAGFTPFWSQRIPPNDGGIACGQVVAAAWATTGALS